MCTTSARYNMCDRFLISCFFCVQHFDRHLFPRAGSHGILIDDHVDDTAHPFCGLFVSPFEISCFDSFGANRFLFWAWRIQVYVSLGHRSPFFGDNIVFFFLRISIFPSSAESHWFSGLPSVSLSSFSFIVPTWVQSFKKLCKCVCNTFPRCFDVSDFNSHARDQKSFFPVLVFAIVLIPLNCSRILCTVSCFLFFCCLWILVWSSCWCHSPGNSHFLSIFFLFRWELWAFLLFSVNLFFSLWCCRSHVLLLCFSYRLLFCCCRDVLSCLFFFLRKVPLPHACFVNLFSSSAYLRESSWARSVNTWVSLASVVSACIVHRVLLRRLSFRFGSLFWISCSAPRSLGSSTTASSKHHACWILPARAFQRSHFRILRQAQVGRWNHPRWL